MSEHTAEPDTLAIRCLQASALASTIVTVMFWGSWWLVGLAWVLVVPMALLLGLAVGFIEAALGAKIETANIWDKPEDIKIVASSDEIVGVWQDAKIHEWVDLQRPDNGEIVRLLYDRTVEKGASFLPPEKVWFALVSPGILYSQPAAVVPGEAAQA